MRRAEAYAFACPFELPEMLARLNALGKHEWIIGDSAWYGDYLKVWTYRDLDAARARLRIYEFPEQAPPFVIEMILESTQPDAETAWQAFSTHVWQEIFPALDARAIAPTDPVD
jgi:hypothetical protein